MIRNNSADTTVLTGQKVAKTETTSRGTPLDQKETLSRRLTRGTKSTTGTTGTTSTKSTTSHEKSVKRVIVHATEVARCSFCFHVTSITVIINDNGEND